MATETRAAFADRHGVNRATVTKWGAKGLLVLTADGKVDVEKTDLNLDQRPATYRGGTAHRPIRTLRKPEPDPRERPTKAQKPAPAPPSPTAAGPSLEDDAARIALVWAFRLHTRIVATSVLEAGGSMEVAYAAARIAHSPTIDSFTLALRYLGHPEFQGDEADLGLRATGSAEPDWVDLARRGGMQFDRVGCDAHLAARSVESARFDAPDARTFETDFTLADLVAGTPYAEP